MRDNKDIEKMLLNNSSYEEIMKTKIENEFKQELKTANKKRNKKC